MGIKKLGEILVGGKLITEAQLKECLDEQRRTKEYLGAILVRKKYVKEADLMQALSEQFNIPVVSLKEEPIDWKLCMQHSQTIMSSKKVMPIYEDDRNVIVAVRDPLDKIPLSNIELAVRPKALRLVLVCESELVEFIEEVRRRSRANLKNLLDNE